jgi:formamidopyrimidine-DNA glycosylase
MVSLASTNYSTSPLQCGHRIPGPDVPEAWHTTFSHAGDTSIIVENRGCISRSRRCNQILDYFNALLAELRAGEKRSAKALLTQEQLIPGLGNAIAQNVMFRARLHPNHPIADLDGTQQRALYDAILATVQAAITGLSRNDEFDLYGKPGGYRRVMDSGAVGQPCPSCGAGIEKIHYLGGACYFCPRCQA